ncbi:MAG: hypothetical protein QOF11_816 [Chloroflexota bacterium]|nr:hypothetical protein [Chloroflexota bacterium]
MRGTIVLPDVGLDLDDPAGDATDDRVVGDQPAADQRACCGEGRLGQDIAGEDRNGAQFRGKSALRSPGTSGPAIATKAGMIVERKAAAVAESLTAV